MSEQKQQMSISKFELCNVFLEGAGNSNRETYRNCLLMSFCQFLQRQPAVLRGVDIGECGTKWTAEYLASVGGKREVKLHVCPTHQMDFINKNFAYKSLPFNEFIRRAAAVEDQEKFFISKVIKVTDTVQ